MQPLSFRIRSYLITSAATALLAGAAAAAEPPVPAAPSAATPAPTAAATLAPLVQQALDKQIKITLAGPLPDALAQITALTGVRFVITPAAGQILPYGPNTNVSARIENQTLRQALDAISLRLGLTYEARADVIELRPVDGLARRGPRRATLDELASLNYLAATRMPADWGARLPLEALVDKLNKSLPTGASGGVGGAAGTSPVKQFEPRFTKDEHRQLVVDLPPTGSLLDALEAISHTATDYTWYLWGNKVELEQKEVVTRLALSNIMVDRRWDQVDLSQVLLDLGKASGIPFAYEPGCLQRVRPESQKITLAAEGVPLTEVLENVQSVTGLGYVPTRDGIYFWNNSPYYGLPPATASASDPIILLIPVTGGNGAQLAVRSSQLPPELREKLLQMRTSEIEKLNGLLK